MRSHFNLGVKARLWLPGSTLTYPSATMADYEEENDCCPLCMEELDITDQTFNACPCGYQVCLWCWHQIKNEYNGLCPACRQPYAELSKQKNPLDREEVVRRTKQRKQKEKNERRSAAQAKQATVNRKSLQNVRVMQRNLVYVIGLPVQFAEEDILRSNECFGQYGKIVKAVVNKSHLNADRANATASAYITFANKDDALCCIVAIDGYYLDGSLLRASFGTTKYCNFFLRNMQCNNPDCLYLHELGDEDDSFTKEEMQSALHSGKAFRDMSMANGQIQEREGSRFPAPHRPHTPTRTASAANARAPSPARGTTLVRSHSEEPYGDTQRHAQSAAAISKLRQAAGDSSNSSGSSSPDHIDRATAHSTEYPPLTRGHSYSNIVAGGHSSSTPTSASVPAPVPPVESVPNKKPDLRVDTSREEDKKQAVGTMVGPLEALKLATGSSTEQPAWAQPFPTPAVSQNESEETNVTNTADSSSAGVYSPFGLGFDGGIRRASSAIELMSKPPVSGDVWGSSTTSDSTLDSFPSAAPTMSGSASSSLSFASIDAIFSQRNDSSEALAGLLGVQVAPNPLAQPLAAPTKDAHTSRFSFANPADAGRGTTARYELLDGTTVNNRSSFGGFDAPRSGNAPPASSGFPATTDRSGFPPLGSSQQHHMPPPHPSRSSFGGDFGSNDLPLGGSSALGGEAGGLAFLQQMLPNVNISFGGDYPSLSESCGVGVTTTPTRSASTGHGRNTGRRLFERSQSAGGGLVSPDAWDGGSLSSLGFDGQSSARRASSGSSFYDPALVSQSSSGFSSNLYGFNATSSMAPNDGENDRLRMHSDFGGDAYRRSGSLINNTSDVSKDKWKVVDSCQTMRSEHNADNDTVEINDAGNPIDKLHGISEATEASLSVEETEEEFDLPDGEAHDSSEDSAHDLEFEKPDELVTGRGFVAAWILANFPDITSEAQVKSQAEQADCNTSMDPADCSLALCFRCTDAIHIIPSLSTHNIHFGRSTSANQTPEIRHETRFEAEATVISSATRTPTTPTTKATPEPPSESRLSLPAGTHIFFRAPDCSRWSRELLHGTLISREPATTSSGGTFYHRVLWIRGVEALPNGFFRAALPLPGWDISSDNEDDIGETFWPHEIGVFPTQLGALRAVVTAEQIARGKFRCELEGGRIHRWRRFERDDCDEDEQEAFPSSEILDEIVVETGATLGSEFLVRLTHHDDVKFHQELAQGTWSFRDWMKIIGRAGNLHEEDAVPFETGVASWDSMFKEDTYNEELEKPVPTPWSPATRIRYFMVAQSDLVFPERVRRQHLRAILDQLLFVYAGFAWRLWREYVERHREREEQQSREHAARVLQAWARRLTERTRQKERQLLLNMALGSSIDALELYRRRQIEARKLYAFLTRQMKERERIALRQWRDAIGPSNPPPPPAITWHPSHGMKAMLPKLPRMGARRRTAQDKSVAPGTQVIVEDMATYKLFKANHTGPADTSYWAIRARVLAGACPIGPAFREARRLVSRTDFATSVLLQQISVFVCLQEPQELQSLETAAAGTDTDWSYERQVRTKYQALCRELKGAETVSNRHVALAQQALIDFDADAANVAAAALGSSGTKDNRMRRASLSVQQLQEEDDTEEAKMKEAREVLQQKLQRAEQQAVKASQELVRLGMMQIEFLYFPIEHDGIPDSDKLITFLEEQVESRLRAGKNLYIFSRLGHGRTGLVSALLLGRVYGITASEALERVQAVHDCQRPGAPRGLSFCSPTTAPQLAFVRRALARSMDPIYVPLVLENSGEGFRLTRVQQRGLLAEPYMRDEGFMISAVADARARECEALEQKRLERIARRESTAAALQRERRKQKKEHEIMEIEEGDQAAREVMASIYKNIEGT
ncbi:hypothetical protein PI124_g5058 [Phytophthora idaei]|nr:hypothetical protein PI125_g18211 [Phytophthora idaei]KAG3138646.1 hypothetical protein PI126_g16829 [Phytophthora idaei]KAG3250280.1 hypothetical protein PI124_g5058 [Phytophthora idaei]